MTIAVEIRDNLILSLRIPPATGPLVINQYSTVVVAVWNRAQALAAEPGHHVVGIHHFISALFADSDARAQLKAAGYADDNEEIRKSRYSRFGSHRFAPVTLPAKRLIESERLQAWFKAANGVAAQREPELQTITVGDFLRAVAAVDILPTAALSAVQAVLAVYKQPRETPFPTRVGLRFDDLDKHLDRQDADAERNRGIIAAAVDGVGAAVNGVGRQVETVRANALAHRQQADADYLRLKGDTTLLVKALPGEVRLSKVLMGLAFTLAVVTGLSVGLLTRWHFGVL